MVDPNDRTKVLESSAPPQRLRPEALRGPRENVPRAVDQRAQRLQDFFMDPLEIEFVRPSEVNLIASKLPKSPAPANAEVDRAKFKSIAEATPTPCSPLDVLNV